jgi:putative flippase GtrA
MKYILVSAIALVIDLLAFRALTKSSYLSVPIAASISYCLGLVFAYIVFVTFIFRKSRYANQRLKQVFLFGISGALGSLSTYLVSKTILEFVSDGKWVSKIIAVGVSFVSVYLFRSRYVFLGTKELNDKSME